MKVNEFVEQYKKCDKDGKDAMLKQVLTTQYVSYAIKIADCKRILDSTCYTNTKPNMFSINSPAREMLLKLQMIDRYTDLEIEFNEALDTYDMLDEAGALEDLLGAIPFREVVNYDHIMKIMLKDFKMNERSMVGYLDSKMASLGIIGETLNNLIEDMSV